MSPHPLRVAFAGLAHSHPYTDAANMLTLGAEVVAVHDNDAVAAEAFTARFGGAHVDSVRALIALRPDVVIATPRPDETVPLVRTLRATDATMPVFFNKVVAATDAQLAAWESALEGSGLKVGTASVLRFAPALDRMAAALVKEEILGIRVHVQHDNAGFQLPGRAWQDDPAAGGGTLVTVGIHAWELINRLAPGASLDTVSGWTRSATGATTRSEDAAGVDGRLRMPQGGRPIPVQVTVTGVPGPDRYAAEVLTAAGIRRVELDVDDAIEALGFAGLARTIMQHAAVGRVPAPWTDARAVVANTIRAAGAARGGTGGC